MCEWVCTQQCLKNLQKLYEQVRGLPKPIYEGIWLRNSFDAVSLKYGVADVYYTPEYSYYHHICPNPSYYPYSLIEQGRKGWKAAKNNEFGLTLWVMHLEQMKGTIFDEDNQQELIMGEKNIDTLLDQLELKYVLIDTERSEDQETIKSIRNKSNSPYFASVLGLKIVHLELVKTWKRDMLGTLRNFEVSEEEDDNIRLYFHWPYTDDTVTLHLHARINQGSHPLEEDKSITLDKIEILEQGKSIEEFILEKAKWYTTVEDYHFLTKIDGFYSEAVYNKFSIV